MNSSISNFEPAMFLYFCSIGKITTLPTKYWKTPSIKLLHELSIAYNRKFLELPWNLENPDISQIKEVVNRNPDKFILNPDESIEQNNTTFLSAVSHIIATDLKKYNHSFLKETSESWLQWEDFQEKNKNAIEYIRGQVLEPGTISQVIKKAKSIISSAGDILLDEDDLGDDFYDPCAHVVDDSTEKINSGYTNLNKAWIDHPTGGIPLGTTTLVLGETNIGKSIWGCNFARNIHLNGYNVIYISLEMSTDKIFKRVGAGIFDIDIGDYSKLSTSLDSISAEIKRFKDKTSTSLIPPGIFRAKRFGGITPSGIQSYVRSVEQKLDIKVHCVIVDYLNEVGSDHGYTTANAYEAYSYHKSNMNDLYKMGVDNNWAMIVLHQLSGTGFGAEDITMSMSSESKGILHRPDCVLGIIQTPEMKVARRYYMKVLKSRDGVIKDHKIEFEIDYTRMMITETGTVLTPGDALL